MGEIWDYSYEMKIETLKTVYTANLKQLRTAKKLSQAELSEKIHITEKFYSDIETGRKWGSFETIVDLANALDVEPYELFLLPNLCHIPDKQRWNQNIYHIKQLYLLSTQDL